MQNSSYGRTFHTNKIIFVHENNTFINSKNNIVFYSVWKLDFVQCDHNFIWNFEAIHRLTNEQINSTVWYVLGAWPSSSPIHNGNLFLEYKAGSNSIPPQARNSRNIPRDPSRISTRRHHHKPTTRPVTLPLRGGRKQIAADKRIGYTSSCNTGSTRTVNTFP